MLSLPALLSLYTALQDLDQIRQVTDTHDKLIEVCIFTPELQALEQHGCNCVAGNMLPLLCHASMHHGCKRCCILCCPQTFLILDSQPLLPYSVEWVIFALFSHHSIHV